MAGRFPGADDLDAFWRNLRDGVESISFFERDELIAEGIDAGEVDRADYVRAKGVLRDADLFDAEFFGYVPSEAETMDPQHRLFLQSAWEALERAGYDAGRYDGLIGVFAGASLNTYLLHHLLHAAPGSAATLDGLSGVDKDFLATRVSYKMNLKGPSVVVQTACSTSLVAICQACQSLLTYQCDMALAGGVSITVPLRCGHRFVEGGIGSPDGRCRAFDAQARGTVNGNGLGVLVLKRLSDAMDDGDTIDAVILGSAVNNDGAAKIGYTAPGVEGQAKVVALAHAVSDLRADAISYVEAHGTATGLGDPIEIAALTEAFRATTDRTGYCAIGSVKTNIGHLDVAAGVAGVIKTVLALQHRQILPSLHYDRPNPDIDFDTTPFFVNTQLHEWDGAGTSRRAGVSSFGIGGTNAHVVLEEAPCPAHTPEPSRPFQLMTLSARTEVSLDTATHNLAHHLERTDVNLADAAHTLHVGRKEFAQRRCIVCHDADDAVAALTGADERRRISGRASDTRRRIVFMFPGQGAQHAGMGHGIYEHEAVFREQVDRCLGLIPREIAVDLKHAMYDSDDPELLARTAIAQPALFITEYAMARLWMSWGFEPDAMIGHSIGEYVAACLAGVFSLEDALTLVAARGKLMQVQPAGAMTAVDMTAAGIEPYLSDDLDIAAFNEPGTCVVSGSEPAIRLMEQRLEGDGIDSRRLRTRHAFHSAMMEPVVAPFSAIVRDVPLDAPKCPFGSNVTGTWITDVEACSADYWASHLRLPVRFEPGLAQLLEDTDAILIEVGPGRTLSAAAARHPSRREGHEMIATMRHAQTTVDDESVLLEALGRAWVAGAEVDWAGFHRHEKRRRIPMPTYPFEPRRYWVERRRDAPPSTPDARKPIEDWFYVPTWTRMLPEAVADRGAARRWLIVGSSESVAERIGKRVEANGDTVTCMLEQGEAFPQKMRSVLDDTCDGVIHVGLHQSSEKTEHRDWPTTSYRDLSATCRALAGASRRDAIDLIVLTSNVHDVTGTEPLDPHAAMLAGPCRVIGQEAPHVRSRQIDIVQNDPHRLSDSLLDMIVTTAGSSSREPVIAIRGAHRWAQTFAPTPLQRGGVTARLRDDGVYLITGGLGRIGLKIASYLARTLERPRLVFLGRSELPPRSHWSVKSDDPGMPESLRQRLREIMTLESEGADVLVQSADVSDEAAMSEVFAEVDRRFGTIHGVLHAAGITAPEGFGAIENSDLDSFSGHYDAKVRGTIVLDRMLQRRDVEIVVLFSSLASILGGLGFAAYAAANAFMDGYARQRNRRGGPSWQCVNWDGWTFDDAGERGRSSTVAKFAISPEDGIRAFDRILSWNLTDVCVSTGDLNARLDQWVRRSSAETINTEEPFRAGQARPELPTSFAAPATELQRTLAELWQTLFGIEPIGVHDDFFDLGGHSLLATQLLNKLSQRMPEARLSLSDVFDRTTIARLAELIDERTGEDDGPADAGRMLLEAPGPQRRDLARAYIEGIAPASRDDDGMNPLAPDAINELIWSLKRDLGLSVYPNELRPLSDVDDIAGWLCDQLDARDGKATYTATASANSAPQRGRPVNAESAPRNPTMVFVLSAPRSGSTLLRLMLAGHSGLFCPPELGLLACAGMRQWQQRAQVLYARDTVVHALRVLTGDPLDACAATVDDWARDDASTAAVYRRLQKLARPRMLVDKTPIYAASMSVLERAEALFEAPRYLHLVRHPWSVIDSYVRHRIHKIVGDDDVEPYASAQAHWSLCQRNILELQRAVEPERFIRVRYEDLVKSPDATMERISDGLDIGFETAMLRPYEPGRMIDGPGDPDIFQHEGIDARLADAWHDIVLPEPLDAGTAALAATLGYDLPDPTAPPQNDENAIDLDALTDEQVDALLRQVGDDDPSEAAQ